MVYEGDVPFDVVEEYEVQDLTDVKADRNLFPVTSGLLLRVNKAGTQMNKNKDIYALKLELRTVNETPIADGKVIKANYPVFNGLMDLVYGAKMDVDGRTQNKWWQKNQHLVEFKNFLAALGIPLSGVKVNDEFLGSLLGREVLVNVVHEAEKVTNEQGEKVPTGDFNQKLKGWKKAA